MQFITAHWSYHHHCSSSLGPTKQYKTKWPLFWQIHLLWEVLPRNPGRWGGIVRWSHSTCHVSLPTISLPLSSSLMNIKPVIFCNILLLKFFFKLKCCLTFIVFPFRKISKGQFSKLKNDQLDYEPFVECDECGRKMHQICVLHFEPIWPNG